MSAIVKGFRCELVLIFLLQPDQNQTVDVLLTLGRGIAFTW